MNIATRAMILRLSVGQATFRKLDKDVSREVSDHHAAAADAGRYNKQLIPKEALLPMAQIASAARIYVYQNTLPWSDNGDRVLLSSHYFNVMGRMQVFASSFHVAADKFAAEYDVHRERSRFKLNSLFKDEDYPLAQDVRAKFHFTFGVTPLPTAGDFRVDMSQDVVDDIKAELTTSTALLTKQAMDSVWEELRGTISHLRARLAPDTRLHETALSNIEDLMERLPGLNLTNDAGLDQMRSMINQTLVNYNIKDLRTNDAVRSAALSETDQILAQMAGLYGA